MPLIRSFSLRNIAALILIIASLVVLYPGLTQPMLNLTIAAKLPFVGEMEFYNKTQSIMESVQSLIDSDNTLVAVLIFLFSVAVPVTKILLLLVVLLAPMPKLRKVLHQIILAIGKWSMADVFVVGLFMAFLAGQAHPSAQASLHPGFYYFLGYCVLSILGAQLIKLPASDAEPISDGA